jgi:2'-5' RNA ligase
MRIGHDRHPARGDGAGSSHFRAPCLARLPEAVAGGHTAGVRLFVALDVPAEAVEHLDRSVAAVRERHDEVRWVPCRRWHVTLAFLGEVDEPRVEPLSQRLARVAARHARPSLCFAGAGRFGSRVLWAGLDGDRQEVVRLAQSVGAAARKAGVPVDERVHRPHLTLARSRTTSLDLRPVVTALADYHGPPWVAGSFSLVRSQLGAEPHYETLQRWALCDG